MPKVKIEKDLYEKIEQYAEKAGYSSTDEFIVHTLEKIVEMAGETDLDEAVKERLKGLGYLE